MVAYISSVKYNSIISSVVKEKDEIIAHNLINDHVNLYKYIQANVTLFSGYDYFIVLTGITSDGKVTVNDPNYNHREKSSKHYDFDSIKGQFKGYWSMTR